MLPLRLTNIDNRYDRGSHRMRFVAAGLLACVARVNGGIAVSGAAVTRACLFSILTGGLGMCCLVQLKYTFPFPQAPNAEVRLGGVWVVYSHSQGTIIREQLAASQQRSKECWCERLLSEHDVPMVWGQTRGRPRVQCVRAEVEDGADVEVANVDVVMEEHDKEVKSCLGKAMSPKVGDALKDMGLQLLKCAREQKVSWGEVSHAGFRPMNLCGFTKAEQIWKECCDRGWQWSKTSTYSGSTSFPVGGLCYKVLLDRTSNLTEFSKSLVRNSSPEIGSRFPGWWRGK